MNTFLIGFMGAGKSTIGKHLAQSLIIPFIDLDDHIEYQEQMSINDIFEHKGERYFRELESKYLHQLASHEPKSIIALGGGTPCNDKVWTTLAAGITIYLKKSPKNLFRILASQKMHRPLIKDLEDAELEAFITRKLVERQKYYERSNYILELSGNINDTVAILSSIHRKHS